MAFITVAGEAKIAERIAASEPLVISYFVLANVPGLGAEPVGRVEALPSAGYIVRTQAVTQQGYVNANQVVYSLVMDTTVGDFSFNWVGLKEADGTLIAVAHLPGVILKKHTTGSQQGNNLTRNFLIAYSGIQAVTGVDVPAETWQIEFTPRLAGIDQRERLANLDLYGHSTFFGDGFVLSHIGANSFQVNSGLSYIGGIRAELASDYAMTIAARSTSVWVDTSLQGDISGVSAVVDFQVAASLGDYVDGLGFAHYVSKIGSIDADGDVTDHRSVVQAFSALGEFVDNAISTALGGFSSYALIDGIISQQYNFVSTAGGTQPDYTGTVDGVTALAVGMRFCVKFNESSTGLSSTLNINGIGAKDIKYRGADGTLYDAIIKNYHVFDLYYDGTRFCVLNPVVNVDLSGYAQLSGATFSGISVPDRPDLDNTGNAANTRFIQSALTGALSGLIASHDYVGTDGNVNFSTDHLDGLIFKWGTATSMIDEGTQTVTFTNAFPNKCIYVFLIPVVPSGTDYYHAGGFQLKGMPTAESFQFMATVETGGLLEFTPFWFAIGN